MFDIALFLATLIGIALVVLGVSVYARNTQNFLNRIFFAFSTCAAIWIGLNYAANSPLLSEVLSLWANRILLILGSAMLLLFIAFILQLAGWGLRLLWFRCLVALSMLTWLLCLTPLVIENVSANDGIVENIFGPLVLVYFVPMFVLAVTAVYILILAHLKLKGRAKSQVDSIAKSMIIVIPVLVFGNAVLPLSGRYTFVNYAPLSLVFLVVTLAYVIIKHRLFNIRSLIVRSMAYAVSLGFMSIVYAVGIHYFAVFLDRFHNSLLSGFGNILLVVLVIAAYQRVKRLFDRLTNSLFYKDAYDPQALLNDLNRVHVANLDLRTLAIDSMGILAKYLKTEFCTLSLIDSNQTIRHFSVGDVTPSEDELSYIYNRLKNSRQRLFITDNVEDSGNNFVDFLEKSRVAVVMQLHQGSSAKGIIGYLTIGQRRSGIAFTNSDLRILETIVNELTLAIQNALHFEEIQQFNITLQERVEQATKELRKTNDKLKKLDETKDEFISMASHQLRTPLTSVKGYLSMVLEGDAGELNDLQRQLLGQSYSSSQRMVYLISDLLNLSRLNTGKFVIEPAEVDLREVVAAEIDQLRETAKSRGVSIVYNAPQSFPVLMLDETKTHQVVMNFLDNAIYYTPTGGEVHVSLVETATAVEYRVKDSGIGVPRSEQHRLFSKFYRAENARRVRPDGTGLGLFMSKKVVVAQGGSIIFESEEGKGSTFGFRFGKSHFTASKG